MKPQRPGDQLERFFELSVDMIGIAGFDGYFKKLGRSWERVLGFTPEELMAKPFIDFVHPDDVAATNAEAQKVVSGTSAVQFTNRYRCRDGSYRWIEWNSTAYPEEEVVYFVARDIADRKRAEETLFKSEARFRAAVDGSLDAFYVFRAERDDAGGLVDFVCDDVNLRGAAVAGRRREELVGRRLSALLPENRALGFSEKYEQVFSTGIPLVEETALQSPDAEAVWIHHQIVPLADGVALTARNITSFKRLELELREALERRETYAAELEDKNRMLASENAERERAEALMRQQQETMLAMSTPIIQAWEGVLVLPIIGTVDTARAAHVMERLLSEIVRTRADFAILDLTGVSGVDTATVAHLLSVVRAAALLGSRCIVSGISPAIAQTMTVIGGAEGAFMTFGLLQDALRHALSRCGVARAR